MRLVLPPHAIGKDWLGLESAVARTPSCTGYHVSLFGLFGVPLAWEEGLEVNLFGLTFGVDPMGLVIKLPFWDRIGVPRRWPRAWNTGKIRRLCLWPWFATGVGARGRLDWHQGRRGRNSFPKQSAEKTRMKSLLEAFALACGLVALSAAVSAQDKEVTIGYQLAYNPWKVAIADGIFETATGYKINWRKFDSGAKVITAMASGDLQIAMAGSSPIAAGVSRGVDLELFWIVDDIASAEALVVRDGSGIAAPQDLKGKKLAVPFVSTTHFHTLFALEQFGIDPSDVDVLNMQPNEISAAWERGEIDAAFVWGPALSRIKTSGKVLITSGLLSTWGKATFDGMVVSRSFAQANGEFMTTFVKVIAAADASYRDDITSFSSDSENAAKIVKMVGGDPKDVPGVLALYKFPTLEQQASCVWLGCGRDGGAARALQFTSEFLKTEKKIHSLQSDYGNFVNPSYVKAAMK